MRLGGLRLSSFKLKLVAYFVLLSLVPMAATYWGFSTVAGAGESRQVDPPAGGGSPCRAHSATRSRANRAQARAEQLARSRPLQRALERRDRRVLRRILADQASLYVVGTGGLRAGSAPRLAARFPVDVVTGTKRLGEVVATIPLDGRLVERLRRGVGLRLRRRYRPARRDAHRCFVPPLRGQVALAAGRSATVRVGGHALSRVRRAGARRGCRRRGSPCSPRRR